MREAIETWEAKLKVSEGHEAFVIKKALIEMRKDQYVIKNAYRRPIVSNKITRSKFGLKLEDNIYKLDEDGYPIPEGVSLLSPEVCSIILCNYSKLKQESYNSFNDDIWYLMENFDIVSNKALKDYPLYERIVEYKIDGMQNIDIQIAIQTEFGIKHSLEYISSLWRNKIPKLIASAAEDDYLDWYYREVERGKYKRCSRCGQIKLAHNKYFSKNKTSKDGFYSICKSCRNSKDKKS